MCRVLCWRCQKTCVECSSFCAFIDSALGVVKTYSQSAVAEEDYWYYTALSVSDPVSVGAVKRLCGLIVVVYIH